MMSGADGSRRGWIISGVLHLVLLGLILINIPWPRSEPTPTEAVPEIIQAEVVERDPIAERRRAEAERQAQREAEEQAQREAEEALRRQMEAEAERLAAQQAARDQRLREQYVSRIRSQVQRNWRIPESEVANPRAVVRVRLAPDGTVLSVRTVDSSGDESFDQSLERAVLRASPLPVPDGEDLFQTYFREFNIAFRP